MRVLHRTDRISLFAIVRLLAQSGAMTVRLLIFQMV